MITVTPRTLKILAAILWYIGVIILITKGADLASNAQELKPEKYGQSIAWIIGVSVGLIKTHFIFDKSCRKNLKRIDELLGQIESVVLK